MIGQTVSHHRIIEKLGGQSVAGKANDVRSHPFAGSLWSPLWLPACGQFTPDLRFRLFGRVLNQSGQSSDDLNVLAAGIGQNLPVTIKGPVTRIRKQLHDMGQLMSQDLRIALFLFQTCDRDETISPLFSPMKLDGLFLDPRGEVTLEKISKTLFGPVSDLDCRAEYGCILLICHDFQRTQTLVLRPHPNKSDNPSSATKWHRQEILVYLCKQVHVWAHVER